MGEESQSDDTGTTRCKQYKQYKQFYRSAWEEVPEFKDWISPMPGNRSLAYCRICEKSLHAHRLSLTKHVVSLRHTRLQTRLRVLNEVDSEDQVEPPSKKSRIETDFSSADGTGKTVAEKDYSTIAGETNETDVRSNCGISTLVIDVSRGIPASGLSLSLYKLINGRWTLLLEGHTSGDGRCLALSSFTSITKGRYKLHFDTGRYFVVTRQTCFFPFIEVVLDVVSTSEKHHIPILLNPFGYSISKGNDISYSMHENK